MKHKRNKAKGVFAFGILALCVSCFMFTVPTVLNAASAPAYEGDPVTDPNFQLVSTECGKSIETKDKDGNPTLMINRECGWADLLVLLNRIINYVISISAFIAVLSFVYAGFLYLTAFGEMGKVEQAHRIFSSTVTGIVIILIAWLIIASILKVMKVGQDFTILDLGQPINRDGLNNVRDLPSSNQAQIHT